MIPIGDSRATIMQRGRLQMAMTSNTPSVDEPSWRRLHAGSLSLVFDSDTGWLRDFRLGGREILQAIYVAVRDRFWETIPTKISGVQLHEENDGFTLSFTAECRRGSIDFAWQGEVSGDRAGTVTFHMDGQARATFWKARIGICVLHPAAEYAGRRCMIVKSDGTEEHTAFPQEIAPHQPFRDIHGMRFEADGVSAELQFEGDIFETEDQRNWTDPSFKTYCTPLALPWPVELPAGARVAQSVTLRLLEKTLDIRMADAPSVLPEVRVNGKTGTRLPRIGLGMASHGQPLSAGQIDQVRKLRPAHLRLDLCMQSQGIADQLHRATVEARELGVVLEIALLLGGEPERELRVLADPIGRIAPPVGGWLICRGVRDVGTEADLSLARHYLSRATPAARFGLGTNGYFAHLNRTRPEARMADFIGYSLNPQVHAFDDRSIVESLNGQQWTAEAARRLFGRSVAVTPVTLKPRFNPHAASAGVAVDELASVDARQFRLFAAAWTLGSVRRLGLAGVESITYFETIGWRGILAEHGSETFSADSQRVFPIYHVFADLAELAGRPVDWCECSRPLEVEAMAFGGEARPVLLIANLSAQTRQIIIPWARGWVRFLDDSTLEQATHHPTAFRAERGEPLKEAMLRLGPYAVARIESEALTWEAC